MQACHDQLRTVGSLDMLPADTCRSGCRAAYRPAHIGCKTEVTDGDGVIEEYAFDSEDVKSWLDRGSQPPLDTSKKMQLKRRTKTKTPTTLSR
jgi:hypothetical protein